MPSPAEVIAKLKADAAIAAHLYRAAQIIAEIQCKYPGLLKRVSADRILRKANEIAQERRQQG